MGVDLPTWEEMVAHEPRLNDVLAWCRSRRAKGDVDWPDYDYAKRQLSALVGWSCKHDGFLETSEAYMVAIKTITDALNI